MGSKKLKLSFGRNGLEFIDLVQKKTVTSEQVWNNAFWKQSIQRAKASEKFLTDERCCKDFSVREIGKLTLHSDR